ncbi:MAG TPA: TlpA disulfide reductase family protein [Candidatus Acidoferrales bacterium]|nr:TlpA disulfide reductase family protein [Candidatus Acidoferrales bacterium]
MASEKPPRTDRLLRLGIGILTIGLVFAIYLGIHERVVVAGDSAPGFTLTADNGRTVSLTNFGGKVLVLNFWATWCPPCVEETPSLSRFAAQYADKGVVVLAVSVDRDEKAYRKFLEKYKPSFMTVREDKLHGQYGTFMYPESYVIDAKGKVVAKYPEAVDWSNPAVAQLVNSLL